MNPLINSTDAIETPPETLTNGPLSKDIDKIVAHVQATHLLGLRAAKRYVGRYLTQVTLRNWRVHNKFPIGFRNPEAVIHDDSGAELKHAARVVNAVRGVDA